MTSVGLSYEEENKELKSELLHATGEQNKVCNDDDDESSRKQCKSRCKEALSLAETGKLLDLIHYIHQYPTIISYKDDDGYTALHRASYNGHLDCVKYLIKHHSDINAKTNDLWTPLHCAVRWNNLAVADYLIRNGADVNAKSCGGNTPLHLVASNGSLSTTCDIIQLLLYHPNCDFLAKNASGDTAYDIAKRSGPFYKLWNGVETLFPPDKDSED